ncbi:MAG: FixH family protein [Phycisphaerales bacterium]|nr:FixH family protein [Phycisphaerales bacterium]
MTDRKQSFFERGLHWPVGLVCLFLVSASFVLTTAVIGAGKGSKAIQPDYYARSIDWDNEKERLNTAEKLGWDVRITASPKLDPYANRFVSVMLLDANEQPIQGALVELVAFSQANAHDPFTKVLASTGAGQYQSKVQGMHTNGLWEFQISIRHAGHDALLIKSLELSE